MKCKYRGFEIDVEREKCLAGYRVLYWSIFRDDGYECDSGVLDSSDTVKDMIRWLKKRIDDELLDEDPWNEQGTII